MSALLVPVPSCEISIRFPNGNEFHSNHMYPDSLDCLGNQVWLDLIESVTLAAVQSGFVVGMNKGFPLVEQD